MAVALEAAFATVQCPWSPPCISGPRNNWTEPSQCQTMSQRLLSDHSMLRQLHQLRHLVTHLLESDRMLLHLHRLRPLVTHVLESDMGEHAIVTSLSGLLVFAPGVTFPTGILDLSNPSASVVPVPCVDTAGSMVDTGVTFGLRSLNKCRGQFCVKIAVAFVFVCYAGLMANMNARDRFSISEWLQLEMVAKPWHQPMSQWLLSSFIGCSTFGISWFIAAVVSSHSASLEPDRTNAAEDLISEEHLRQGNLIFEYDVPYRGGTKTYHYEVNFSNMTQSNTKTGSLRNLRRLVMCNP